MIDYMSSNPRKAASTLGGKIAKDIPIVRDKYNVMLNAVGDPVMYDPFQMVSETKADPFWDYVNEHAINVGKPNQKEKIYIDLEGIERGMTDDEYYNFVRTSGKEIKRRIMDDVMPKELSDEDIKKEVSNIKSDVRSKTKTEMFGWGDYRSNYPEKWNKLLTNGVVQVPPTSNVSWIGEDKKGNTVRETLTDDEMKGFNKKAMEFYGDMAIEYLNSRDAIEDKKNFDVVTGGSVFDATVTLIWSDAKEQAKGELIENRGKTNSAK
jgi:hypothetical protein